MKLHVHSRTAHGLEQLWLHGEGSATEAPALRTAALAVLAEHQATPLLVRHAGPGWDDADDPLTAYHGADGAAALCIHAVRGGRLDEQGGVRRWRTTHGTLAATEVTADDPGTACDAIAARLGWDAVQRTWWWLDSILEGYADFNRVRSERFATAGLIRPDGSRRLPASTGIGLRPHGGTVRLEALATPGHPPVPLELTARQTAASTYGSSFARAVVAPSPTGPVLLISGTASIDRGGATLHHGDRTAQARETVACLRAVLAAAGLDDGAIVGGLAYALDAESEAAWRAAAPDWPVPVVRAVVCRPDLLVECELVATQG